ncbi:MAG: DUF4965 domain-containing protein [Bacteroidales bacterium]|jgi:hypothetical protein|nr:DUF4965 domain-containing protein [Bacteroidales bacterium]MCI1786260.1 DUF4965 domain-containing protein [Bacteroidales bacterium]
MKKLLLLFLSFSTILPLSVFGKSGKPNGLRAPAYPLVTIDPYISAWSCSDKLYDSQVKHWTYKRLPLYGVLDVDGKTYRFMGASASGIENSAEQVLAEVQAMQTHYRFTCGPVLLDLTFSAPLFMDNLELMSRPVEYITYSVSSRDGKKHSVRVYFEASPLWAVNNSSQETESETYIKNGLVYLKAGTKSQNILGKKGDSICIDWGYFYFVSRTPGTTAGVGEGSELRNSFEKGRLVSSMKADNSDMAIVREMGRIRKGTGMVMIGYDDIYSVQYFGKNLRPYWNADGNKTIEDEFEAASKDYPSLIKKCERFDNRLMASATEAGGRKYAELCALAYRQAIAAHKLVKSPDGDLHWFSKENNSNGSIGTVDVTYPSSPMFLLYNPKLVEGMMNHIYYYSESGRWTKPFPAHDCGTYPIANGQTYGADMPVEEAGNMIILTAAVCHYEHSTEYAAKHWKVLTTWVEYLAKFGLDPENQLCTDDFAGHFAHNANLSVKAIIGIASYGHMAGAMGKKDIAEKYTSMAKSMAGEWMKKADDGDHYRLTFDKPDTWSQKYNLVWDKLLGLGIFPESVAAKEVSYYKTKQLKYGLPLDNRKTYTKTDWIVWTASLSSTKSDFESFIAPLYGFMNETTDRVPMSDWVYTDKPKRRSFKARSVVGGYFIKMLEKDDK